MQDMNMRKNEQADQKEMIRFIDPNYRELFKIQDGKVVEVKGRDRTFFVACEYLDAYHLRFGNEVYHICELAEYLERYGAVCRPEPEIDEEECAWKVGHKGFLYVQTCEGGYDYQLYHADFKEWDGGQLHLPDGSMTEAKQIVLHMHGLNTQIHERIPKEELELLTRKYKGGHNE